MTGHVRYVRWHQAKPLPNIEIVRAYKVLVVVEKPLSRDDEAQLSALLVQADVASVSIWGIGCERLHDWIDEQDCERHGWIITDDTPVMMTTWHSSETLADAMWFVKKCANYNNRDDNETILLHIADQDAKSELIAMYENLSDDNAEEP